MSGTSSRTDVVGPRSVDDTEIFRYSCYVFELKLTPEATAVLGKQVGIFFNTMEDPNR